MSEVVVASGFGFDTRDFWVANADVSTAEQFTGLQSSEIGLLHAEQTYSTFEFTANGLTYRYIGSFTLTADLDVVDATITASGSYDRIEVLNGGTLLATYDGPSRPVDFGTFETANTPGLLDNLLGTAIGLLFGPTAGDQNYENIYTDATPNLARLAYADGVNSVGGAGEDILTGGVSADTFDGRGGNDRFYGYAGNDTYIIRDAGDRVFEVAGNGDDLVKSIVSYSIAGQDIERLALTGTADINANGNHLDNVITGNSGNNIIKGGGGEDLMKGGGGGDNYFVNSAGDVVVEAAGAGRDAVNSSINYTLTQHVEDLKLAGVGNIDATGNTLANRIAGNAGDNVINGKAGADVLRGNGGADSFVFDTHPVAGNVDRILDFSSDDTIVLDDSVFTALSPGALAASAFKDISAGSSVIDADDRILYNSNNGSLYYDADGAGGTKAVALAKVIGLPGLTADDFLIV
jgi:Ca2+-binding RTX toxin-like protein